MGFAVSYGLKANMLKRAKELTAFFLSEEVKQDLLHDDLTTLKTGEHYEQFSDVMSHLSLGDGIKHLKIWNRAMTIVWSDDKHLVGLKSPDNDELLEAFEGRVVSETIKLDKYDKEHAFIEGVENLMELYIPIERSGRIDTVFEVYKDLTPLYADIREHVSTVWMVVTLGMGALYFLLSGLVKRASSLIERQTASIRRSEERHRNLVQSAREGIISSDRDGCIVLINGAAEQAFGYGLGEAIGEQVQALLPGGHSTEREAVRREGVRKDGQTFPAEVSQSLSGDGDELIMTSMVRDISEREAMNEQIIRAEKQASVAVIAGSIGHELNNTVTALLGYSELLGRKTGDTEFVLKCATLFRAQSQRLSTHAANLLSLGRPKDLNIKPIALGAFLDKVTDVLETSGMLKSCAIKRMYSESVAEVSADEGMLEQVIRNLELNAAQAMNRGGGTLTLGTRFSEDGGHMEFYVADTGIGIPVDERDKIFLPYFTTKEKGKGTGLGMYIVRQIISQHGGYIKMESSEGSGTTVTVGLPVVHAEALAGQT